jgi:uncharacterized protein (TIGR00251 family)
VGICIKAPPVEGQANKAIVVYLADIFGLSKGDVSIEKGMTNKHKIIMLNDCQMELEEIYEI